MRRDMILLMILTFCAAGIHGQTGGHAEILVPAGATPTSTKRVSPVQELAGFDDWVQGIMEEWHVPGVAVGAIRDGNLVLLEGYGYRDIERQLPVTARTLMAIGSNTKSFTVVLMGQLVDSAQIDWDRPVRDFLPNFRLHDEYATSNMRVRDLVTHVSGLPRHDLLWYGSSLDRQALFDRLQYLEPTTSFRGRYQYQNLMFMTAGYLVEQITGRSWETLIDERIFTPLNMARSNTSVAAMPQSDDFAYPYVLDDGELTRVPFRNIDNVGPAGSINSSVEEMLAYIQMHLDSGVVGQDTILSNRNAVLMQTAQSAVGSRDRYPEIGPATYGLGLGVTTYRGHKQVGHTGGIDGFISAMGWLPNDGIGVMVLSNMSGEANPVPILIQRRIFDELLELEPIDWNARSRGEFDETQQRQEEERNQRDAERIAGTSPSHDLAAYEGTYEHPAYGRMEVTLREGALQIRYGSFVVNLTHYHYDVFEFEESGVEAPFSGLVQFLMATDGSFDRLAVPIEPALDHIIFRRARGEQ